MKTKTIIFLLLFFTTQIHAEVKPTELDSLQKVRSGKIDFSCIYLGKIEAKNKGEIDMYFVEGNF